MPLYPAVIKICRMICGEHYYLYMVVAIQVLASGIAVIYLFKAFKLITDNSLLSGIVTIWYGCSSGVMSWDTIILTESFSISISVFYIWALIKYVKNKRLKDGYEVIFLSWIAALIKPTLAVYAGGVWLY